MKLKNYLVVFAVGFVFICVGFQTVALAEIDTEPTTTLKVFTWEIYRGANASTNGGGGDPVDGPGWPK